MTLIESVPEPSALAPLPALVEPDVPGAPLDSESLGLRSMIVVLVVNALRLRGLRGSDGGSAERVPMTMGTTANAHAPDRRDRSGACVVRVMRGPQPAGCAQAVWAAGAQ
ncbi:hypothetical protein rosag_31840 [Roseisolibacter agri]|uniref:Uncharacterized protein n=1 Tax=Roseisolibacter agri TaxID=2014610 RepID=A0AA37QBI2_9BACT|nr:hypothetical protein rosag_31840 [Roseisolibacter agri]